MQLQTLPAAPTASITDIIRRNREATATHPHGCRPTMSSRSPSSSALALSASPSSAERHQSTDNYTISHRAQAPMERHDRSRHSSGESSSTTAELPVYTREEARDAIVASLVQILEQPLAILRNGSVSDEQMSAESRLIPGSSLGKHLRHVHDHYRILLDNLESQTTSDVLSIDYDKRMRVLALETSVKDAVQEFEKTQRRIRHLLAGSSSTSWQGNLNRPIQLTATTPAEVELGSTLGREMWFVCLHSIHHFALARVILVHELGVQIDDSFGVAPSTMVMRLWRQATEERAKL